METGSSPARCRSPPLRSGRLLPAGRQQAGTLPPVTAAAPPGDHGESKGRGGWAASLWEGRDALEPKHRFLLFVLGATSFFDGYDRGILLVALKQVRHTFHLTSSAASWYVGLFHLGALPAVLLTRRADRSGRRRLLIMSVIGYSVATGLTALAPTAAAYAGCQFVAKMFLNAEAAIVWTMAAEELPAKARGLGFGWLSMNGALGVGFGAILYGGVFHPLDISWRWLYVVGLPPLALVAWLRRSVPESRRFEEARDAGNLQHDWRAVLRGGHRRWLMLMLATTFLAEIATQAGTFTVDFLQSGRGLSASTANFMLVAAGLPGIPIMVAAGALSDRLGRRLVGCGFVLFGFLGAISFFWLPGGVPLLVVFMSITLIGQLGGWPVLGSYAAELFPTAIRSQAVAWTTVSRVAGQSASFGLAGLILASTHQSQPITATLLGIGPVMAIVIFWFSFPDTHGRELEDITTDDGGAAARSLGTPALTAEPPATRALPP